MAREIAAKVRSIVGAAAPSGSYLLDAFGDVNRVWDRFFLPRREKGPDQLKATTLRGYCDALQRFLGYVINSPEVRPSRAERLALKRLQAKLPGWKTWLRKFQKLERGVRHMQDTENVLDLGQVKQVINSAAAKKCGARLDLALEEYEKGLPESPVTTQEVIDCRNYLIACLVTFCTARASLISGLTIEGFKKYNNPKVDKHGLKQFNVTEHKTAGAHGPLTVHLDRETRDRVYAYINVFRPLLLIAGKRVASANVHNCMGSFLKKSEQNMIKIIFVAIIQSKKYPSELEIEKKLRSTGRSNQMWERWGCPRLEEEACDKNLQQAEAPSKKSLNPSYNPTSARSY
ncbi:uncharacterized protein LOC125560680 isoform X2 [Nematostella vectensis]|uniref:uncharacterized protein LOC125560680 isoform X2 n=1 Tax=Nematostella vectensis TaxID=45351 RepID=UPI0020771DE4|nr:uncharacterized protein LOC125560680 isoform X2 [Nematostella vectensis]